MERAEGGLLRWHVPHTAAHFGMVRLMAFVESWTAAVTKLLLRTAHPTKRSLLGFKMDGFGFRAPAHCFLLLTL